MLGAKAYIDGNKLYIDVTLFHYYDLECEPRLIFKNFSSNVKLNCVSTWLRIDDDKKEILDGKNLSYTHTTNKLMPKGRIGFNPTEINQTLEEHNAKAIEVNLVYTIKSSTPSSKTFSIEPVDEGAPKATILLTYTSPVPTKIKIKYGKKKTAEMECSQEELLATLDRLLKQRETQETIIAANGEIKTNSIHKITISFGE